MPKQLAFVLAAMLISQPLLWADGAQATSVDPAYHAQQAAVVVSGSDYQLEVGTLPSSSPERNVTLGSTTSHLEFSPLRQPSMPDSSSEAPSPANQIVTSSGTGLINTGISRV